MPDQGPRKIIFDMDGVITSEDCYWNTAALVVWELLFSRRGLGLPLPPELPSFTAAPGPLQVAAVRRIIFQEDRVVTFFKRRAVNSNWDLAFYTFAFHMILFLNRYAAQAERVVSPHMGNTVTLEQLSLLAKELARQGEAGWHPPFPAILEDWPGSAKGAQLGAKMHALLRPGHLAAAVGKDNFDTSSPLWEGVRRIFQEWYLGPEDYTALYGQPPGIGGKAGFMAQERPLLSVERIEEALEELRRQSWVLGIATGRPENELLPALRQMGLWGYFDPPSVVTFNQVEQLQQALEAGGEKISLGKPHPFSLLRAYWGNGRPPESFVRSPFPSPPAGECYLVGDTPADMLAAQAAGVSFIAVLTGHEGAAGSNLFAGQGVSAILPDMTHLPAFLVGRQH